MKQACENGVLLNMITCPGTADKQLRQCIITSWNGTEPVFGVSSASSKLVPMSLEYIMQALIA
ncbi:hypothetical protein JCM18901_959 [Psychrobacter sp. JCM 18901]|nr:hypothetical protein JCM18901_959 [Psychrobacter sp. JCM 18901]